MKFKLKKSEHLHYFSLLRQIDKLSLTIRENKSLNSDSLVFYTVDGKLNIYSSNNISSSSVCLNVDVSEEFTFAIDSQLFYNAFSSFPIDEVNFAYVADSNSLVFGNKKTRVVLKSSALDSYQFIIDDLSISENKQMDKLNSVNLYDSIKFTSFACNPNIDEAPYSSIMIFFDNSKFNSQASDKHRISFYGSKYDEQKSYLITKNAADLINSFIKKDISYTYTIDKNKLYIKWNRGVLSTKMELNTYDKVFKNFQSFVDSDVKLNTKINRLALLKSIKFISSIASSDSIDFRFNGAELIMSGSSSDKGLVSDIIPLFDEVEEIESSYLLNHLVKCLDTIENEMISLSVLDFNGYNVLMLKSNDFKHILFPME